MDVTTVLTSTAVMYPDRSEKMPLKSEVVYGKRFFEKKAIRRAIFKKNEKTKSFHEIIGPVVILGNIFSIFPISGIFAKEVDKLRFSFLNPVTVYSMIVQFCFFVELILLVVFLSKTGLKFFMIGQTVFTFVCIFGGTYFFYLSTKWRRFMIMWYEHERIFLAPPYANKVNKKLSLRIQILAIVILSLSILDHYVYFKSAIERTEIQMEACDESKRDLWRTLYVNDRQVFFQIFQYRAWQIPFLEWYEVVKTECWTYSEVFVSAMAITLATRFEQLTNRLKFYEKRHLMESFWQEIRCHYNILCNLVLKADKVLSPFIVVYSFANLFFICQKIFTQFEKNKSRWELYYSYYSSVFLICRTVSMLCFLSSVNEKRRDLLSTLREVPNKSFNGLDYRRLLDVVHSNSVSLSGFRFFNVTRGMILTVAGTILTYELVLVQQIDDIAVGDNITTNACGELFI